MEKITTEKQSDENDKETEKSTGTVAQWKCRTKENRERAQWFVSYYMGGRVILVGETYKENNDNNDSNREVHIKAEEWPALSHAPIRQRGEGKPMKRRATWWDNKFL